MYVELTETSSLNARVNNIIHQELLSVIRMGKADQVAHRKATLILDIFSVEPMGAFSVSGEMADIVASLQPDQQNTVVNFLSNVFLRWSLELRTQFHEDAYDRYISALAASVRALTSSETMPAGYSNRISDAALSDGVALTLYLLANEYRTILNAVEMENGGSKAKSAD